MGGLENLRVKEEGYCASPDYCEPYPSGETMTAIIEDPVVRSGMSFHVANEDIDPETRRCKMMALSMYVQEKHHASEIDTKIALSFCETMIQERRVAQAFVVRAGLEGYAMPHIREKMLYGKT